MQSTRSRRLRAGPQRRLAGLAVLLAVLPLHGGVAAAAEVTVERIADDGRVATAAEVSAGVRDRAAVVLIARDDDPADALVALGRRLQRIAVDLV